MAAAILVPVLVTFAVALAPAVAVAPAVTDAVAGLVLRHIKKTYRRQLWVNDLQIMNVQASMYRGVRQQSKLNTECMHII